MIVSEQNLNQHRISEFQSNSLNRINLIEDETEAIRLIEGGVNANSTDAEGKNLMHYGVSDGNRFKRECMIVERLFI